MFFHRTIWGYGGDRTRALSFGGEPEIVAAKGGLQVRGLDFADDEDGVFAAEAEGIFHRDLNLGLA